MRTFSRSLLYATLLAVASSAHAGPAERIANAIPNCQWPDKLVPGPVGKLPEQFKIRAVTIPSGTAQVSVVEGFRFALMPDGKTEPFANVKIEQSEADKFASDREAIVANIRWILSTSKDMETTEPLLVEMNGFEGPMINRATLSGSTLALIALFHEKEKLVFTIYLENAPPDKRGFQTKQEWNGMRDRFFVALTSCAAKALAATDASAEPTVPVQPTQVSPGIVPPPGAAPAPAPVMPPPVTKP